MKTPFTETISSKTFRTLPSVVRIIDPPGAIRRTTRVECESPGVCPICNFFAERMTESILRDHTSLIETLEIVSRFSSYSPEAREDILRRVEERLD